MEQRSKVSCVVKDKIKKTICISATILNEQGPVIFNGLNVTYKAIYSKKDVTFLSVTSLIWVTIFDFIYYSKKILVSANWSAILSQFVKR